jgi:hypothetical protein
MNERRNFLKLASAAVIIPAAAIVSSGVARADDGSAKKFLGAWSNIHSLPFPPGEFREFLSFAEGGVLHETNSFLHTASNLDFSTYGLPTVVNAADGVGNWDVGKGAIQVVFRKMMFNGSRQNFGDLHVTGTLRSNGTKLLAEWHIEVVDRFDKVLADLGHATSEGTRIR